jgi:RimJ/RimL family protein N-acetyltransferase
LEGERVKLVPLTRDHTEDLYRAIDSNDIWTYLPSKMEKFEDMVAHVEEALDNWELGIEVPFVVIDKDSSEVIGMTRFEEVSLQNRGLEIGWTWYSKKVWRTRVNTETKFLLLSYCFDVLNLVRVQFRVDTRNLRSRNAVLRIGAKEEGILRKCGILNNSYIRDMVYYSIINDEWSVVKTKIMDLLASRP